MGAEAGYPLGLANLGGRGSEPGGRDGVMFIGEPRCPVLRQGPFCEVAQIQSLTVRAAPLPALGGRSDTLGAPGQHAAEPGDTNQEEEEEEEAQAEAEAEAEAEAKAEAEETIRLSNPPNSQSTASGSQVCFLLQ